jgi:hypothetical protein
MINGKPVYLLENPEIQQVWQKQVESYNHYQAMAQRFIGILSTGLAIIVSFSIGAISILDINDIFGATIDFGAAVQGTPIEVRTLFILWLLTPIMSMMLWIVTAALFYDSFKIHNSVISIESPHPSQSRRSTVVLETSSNSNRKGFMDAIKRNSIILDDMKSKIVAGNTQAKRALIILLYSISIIFYSLFPSGYNLVSLYGVTVLIGIIVFKMYWGYSVSEFQKEVIPESSYFPGTIQITFSIVAIAISLASVTLWLTDALGII